MPNRGRYRILAPNVITAANIASGFAAILVAAEGRFDLAVRLLLLAIVLDMCDGLVARALGATSEFGQEMDSFSDALSFGAAPAFLLYEALLKPIGVWGIVVAVIYLLCGVLRLTRFVLTSDAHAKARRTDGVPIPVAASYIMAMTLMRDDVAPWAAVLVALAMAVLMVSHARLPNLKGRNLVTLMLLVGIGNYVVVVFNPSWGAIVWWNVWNVCILIAAAARERRPQEETIR